MSNPNTWTSPPLAGQPFIVEDTTFTSHRQNRSYNLDDTDTSTHTLITNKTRLHMTSMQQPITLTQTTYKQTIARKTQILSNSNNNKPLIRQTLARTTPRLTIARTTPNTDNNNISLQLKVQPIIDLDPLSNSPCHDSNHPLHVLTELMLMFMTTCPLLEDNKSLKWGNTFDNWKTPITGQPTDPQIKPCTFVRRHKDDTTNLLPLIINSPKKEGDHQLEDNLCLGINNNNNPILMRFLQHHRPKI